MSESLRPQDLPDCLSAPTPIKRRTVTASGMRGHSERWMPEFANQWTRAHYDGRYRNQRTTEVIFVAACEAQRGQDGTQQAVVYSGDVWEPI